MKKTLILLLLTVIVIAYADFSRAQEKAIQKGDVAADSDRYVIGAEDVLLIHVWREDAVSRQVMVRMDGKISLPLIDDVFAVGLTPLQLKDVISKKLEKFIDNPNVVVIVVEANSFKVFVSGEIKSPGVYRLRGETSILQIIIMAGGLTEWANQKKILVIRQEDGKDKRITINYKKLVRDGDMSQNIVLKSGDTIIVP